MSSLKIMRKRISSVLNIQKITRTMEMVAAAQLRKAQLKTEQSRPYATMLKQLLDNFSSADLSHPLLCERPIQKLTLLIIGSDRGLCGSHNANLFSKADRFLHDYQLDQIELIPIGRKVVDYYGNKKWKIGHRMIWWDKISYHEISMLGNRLIQSFIAKETDAVYIAYTEYINVLSRKVVIDRLLPLEGSLLHKTRNQRYLEPSAEQLFSALLPRFFSSKIQSALNEAHASELAARILSMKTATTNAEDMILRLRLESNKLRQASITREIAEISSGAQSFT